MEYFYQLLFGVAPYVAGSIFILGSALRYERGQYTWRTMSSQILHNTRAYRLANIFFHVGILTLFMGHLIGLLTPHHVYAALGLTAAAKQVMSMVVGGIFGVFCLGGISILLWRRLLVPAVRANSSHMDTAILVLLFFQLVTGATTIYFSLDHLDGSVMLLLSSWAQHIVTFQGDAWKFVVPVPWMYKVHIGLGLLMFALFPFSRLVHIWSWPWVYIRRSYQVVRIR